MAPEVKSCPLKVHPSDNKQNPNIGYTTAAVSIISGLAAVHTHWDLLDGPQRRYGNSGAVMTR